MNDEAKQDEKKLIERHKKFFDLERNRFIQIINELDQIIDNCDRQMEDTLHELANQTEMRNQYKDQSQQNGESNANVNKASDNSSFRINSGSGIPDQLQSSDKVHSEEADQH